MTNSVLSSRLLSRFQAYVADIFKARRPRGVALALSGGVDSMALAWLWHTSRSSLDEQGPFGPFRNIPFHAIIINHKLRPESGDEARKTSDRFFELTGQKPLIFDIDWDAKGGIPERSKHETLARRHRYRALGTACRDLDVDAILTGHHADDNAETLLTRITTFSRTVGLQGIGSYSAIPECRDLYGVSERLPVNTKAAPASPFSFLGRLELSIRIARPLLIFDKTDLISLCQENGIEWAEDPTNQDPTLTARNAARHALSSDALPRAFQKPSLLALAASRNKAAKVERSLVDEMHDESRKRLDLRSGVLSIILPENIRSPTCHWRVKCSYVRDILFAVSSNPKISFSECEHFLEHIMAIDKEVRQLELQPELDSLLSSKKTSTYSRRATYAAASVRASVTTSRDLEGKFVTEWHFTRQALSNDQLFKHVVPLIPESDGFKTPHFPRPTIWDGRFWILAFYKRNTEAMGEDSVPDAPRSNVDRKGPPEAQKEQKFAIRGLKAADMAVLRHEAKYCMNTEAGVEASIAIGKYKCMSKLWNMLMPLPVIVSLENEPGQEVKETVVAIPSIGYIRPEHVGRLQVYMAFKWTGAADKGMTYINE